MEIKLKHAYKFKFYVGEEIIEAQFCSNEWNVLWQTLNNGAQRIELIDGEPKFKIRKNEIKGTKVIWGEWKEVKYDKCELIYDYEYNTRRDISATYYPSSTSSHGSGIKNSY